MATQAGVGAVLDRAREMGWPAVSSTTASYMKPVEAGEESWRERVRSASHAELAELSHELHVREQRRDAENREAHRRAALEAPPDPELGRREREHAELEARKWELGRGQRVEDKLDTIIRLLEGRGR